MNVLSLFDGMSCGQIALERAGIKVDNYFASEIKRSAIKVTQENYPNTIQLGDATNIDLKSLPKIDLLIGGSPCQDFSIARTIGSKTMDGLEGKKSSLFYTYLKILKELDPKYFLLENVRMKEQAKLELDEFLGVCGVRINSSLVSFQRRDRYYWTNIPFDIPEDRHISFQDFKDTDVEYLKKFKMKRTKSREYMWSNGQGRNSGGTGCSNITDSEKIYCLTCKQDRAPNSGLVEFEDFCRYLTTRELELAQTVPVGYTSSVSFRQAEDLLGDGWTVDVIAHIFKGIK